MNDESRLDELLDEWEAARQQGQEPAPETLCQDCPELLHELKQRVTRLKHVDRLLYPRSVEKAVPDAPATAGLDAGERWLGRYRLDVLLGKGGFGEVWRAYDPELRRPVAIKVLRPERSLHTGQVERFQDEARKLAQLRHPNIVPVFDVGQAGEARYIVAELVEGENLAAVLKRRRFAWPEAAGLIAKLADAADHAHGRGVIHRDIKPANILLDRHGEPFLADFGIASTLDEARRENGDVSGTVAYMSPEQALASGTIDGRADVYSLGVVLYELLTGERPYSVRRLSDLRALSAGSAPVPPRRLTTTVPVALERACLRALAGEPANRYATAKEFGDVLRACQSRPARRTARAGVVAAVLAAPVILGFAIYLGKRANTGNQAATGALDRSTQNAGPTQAAQREPVELGRVRFAHEAPKSSLNPQDAPQTTVSGPGRFELVVPASVTVGDVSGLDPRARTGILAGKGERIVVKAFGQWRVGPLARHVKGPEILKVAIGMAGKPPTQLETVGAHVEFVVEQPGELFLGTPDTSPGDNRGELNVSIDIQAE